MASVSFKPGSEANLHGKRCKVLRAVDVMEVLVQDLASGETKVVSVLDLAAPQTGKAREDRHPDAMDPRDLEEARQRLEAIRPLWD